MFLHVNLELLMIGFVANALHHFEMEVLAERILDLRLNDYFIEYNFNGNHGNDLFIVKIIQYELILGSTT